jgi:exonuclease III
MGDDYLQWNIRGLLDRGRRHAKVEKVVSFLEKPSSLKILNLQETHLISTEDIPSAFRNFKHLYHIIHNHATAVDRSAGICIFINKTEDIILQQNIINGRLTYLKLKNIASEEIKNIFSYYGKSRSTSQEWSSSFQIMQQIIETNELENIIILGDFNYVTSTLDRNNNQLNSIDNTAKQAWNDALEPCGLLDSLRITSVGRLDLVEGDSTQANVDYLN